MASIYPTYCKVTADILSLNVNIKYFSIKFRALVRIISLINYLSLCKTPQVHLKTQILEEKLFQVRSSATLKRVPTERVHKKLVLDP